MPLPRIDTLVLSGDTWVSARLADESRWTNADLDEAKHLQQLYGGKIPEGVVVLREVVTPSAGIELLASPMRASQRDPSSPVIRLKRSKDGYLRMHPLKKKRKRQ